MYYTNNLKNRILKAIEDSDQFTNIFNDTLDDVITDKLDNIDFSYYTDEIRETIEDNLDIEDDVRDILRDVTKDKIEYR